MEIVSFPLNINLSFGLLTNLYLGVSPDPMKKVKINGSTFKNKNMPKMQHLNKENHYLAIGPRGNHKLNSRKTKILSKNRQLTSKTDDVETRD